MASASDGPWPRSARTPPCCVETLLDALGFPRRDHRRQSTGDRRDVLRLVMASNRRVNHAVQVHSSLNPWRSCKIPEIRMPVASRRKKITCLPTSWRRRPASPASQGTPIEDERQACAADKRRSPAGRPRPGGISETSLALSLRAEIQRPANASEGVAFGNATCITFPYG